MKKLPKQSKYPKQVYVGKEAYKVKFVKGLDCYGETDWEKLTITLKKGMSTRQTLSTFIHELLHAMEFEHSIPLKHKEHVYALEQAILDLLLDNFL